MFQLWKAAAIVGVVQVLLSGCANTQRTASNADVILDGTEIYDGPPLTGSLQVAGLEHVPTSESSSADRSDPPAFDGDGEESESSGRPWLPEILSRSDAGASSSTVSDAPDTAPRLPDSVATVVAVGEEPPRRSDRGWVPTGVRPRTEPDSPSRPQLLTDAPSREKTEASDARTPLQSAPAGSKPALTGGVAVAAFIPRGAGSEHASEQIQLAGLERLQPAPPSEELPAAEAGVPEVQLPGVGGGTPQGPSLQGPAASLLPGSALVQTSGWQGVIEPVRPAERRPPSGRSPETQPSVVVSSGRADTAKRLEVQKSEATSEGAEKHQSLVEFRGSIQSAGGGLMASILVAGSGVQTVREGDQIPVSREGEVRLYRIREITGSSVLLESPDGQLLASQE
jgi:hypothetical protein